MSNKIDTNAEMNLETSDSAILVNDNPMLRGHTDGGPFLVCG